MIELPSVLFNENDFYYFERSSSQPNFVTTKSVSGPVTVWKNIAETNVEGKIILISQADPGFDWLFGKKIAGLITKYGGANSHMAIRAAEMNVPAAIGVGDKLFDELTKVKHIHLDCQNSKIEIL